ncbi:MAG: PIG-L family deacetylase [Actinomycetia bacterium]|nr:PIG-L family deacetylase [Actinomycetes bacterium]
MTSDESTDTTADERLRFLHVAAHPDDLDFGCAGTTATLTAADHDVIYCLVTDGQAGGFDSSISRQDMGEIRRQEQTEAAKVVGVSELHFLGFPDGAVEASLDLRRAISRVIRIVRPDRVITQSYQRNIDRIYGSHPDHLAVGEATLNAVYPDARNEFAFPEFLQHGLEPHTVPEVWLMGHPDPNHFVDISDTIELKIEALLCHESQMRTPEQIPELIRSWSAAQAEAGGLGQGRLAEGFRLVLTP